MDCKRGDLQDTGSAGEFIDVLKTLHKLGLDRTPTRCTVEALRAPARRAWRRPRDEVAPASPNPATLGPKMKGSTCAGSGDPAPARTANALLHLPLPRGRQRMVDDRVRTSMRWCGRRPSIPLSPLELLATTEPGRGAMRAGPRGASTRVPFLELLTCPCGSPWAEELARNAALENARNIRGAGCQRDIAIVEATEDVARRVMPRAHRRAGRRPAAVDRHPGNPIGARPAAARSCGHWASATTGPICGSTARCSR